ncbi:MAG: glycerol-3-phosphate dehydrogenase [Rhizorhabdus sp.]
MASPAELPPCDLLVVGGGINGAGIARDAAGRGLSVVLVEQDDLAAHTSSASTKLIHGGLRYLEYGEFRLVREALHERERLLRIAPHLIRPLDFVLPQGPGSRPGWLIRLGLFLYDRLGGRQTLPRSRAVDLADPRWGAGLRPGIARGFVYADAAVDDSRLVVLNARDAADRGARIMTRTRMASARVANGAWLAQLAPQAGPPLTIRARVLVNAAGPWVASLRDSLQGVERAGGVTLVKGSHIVIPALYPGKHAFLLQQPDGRVVFTIPWLDRFTMIGTTDVPVGPEERAAPQISAAEVEYLCAAVNRWFAREIGPDAVIGSWSGVRPLFDDGKADAKAITRDYVLQLGTSARGRHAGPQVLSVLGGKLTTYRRLAEHALEKLGPWLPAGTGTPWTAGAALPGGDLPAGFPAQVRARWPFLPDPVALRMAAAYGTEIDRIIGSSASWAELGEDFGSGLTEAEVRHLVTREWAQTAEDVLWRRTRLGFTAEPGTGPQLAAWLEANPCRS